MTPRWFRIGFFTLMLFMSGIFSVSAAPAVQARPTGCPVNDYQLVGQRWRAGAVGSVPSLLDTKSFLRPAAQESTPNTDGIIPTDTIRAALVTGLGVDIARFINAAPVSTLIIVVDDFTAPTPEESHGTAVYAVTEDIIAALGLPAARLGLARVDTAAAAYNLSTIATQIEATIRANASYRRFIINMSFIIVPCQGTVNVGGVAVPFNFDQFIVQYDQTGGEVNLYAQAATLAPDLIPPPGDALAPQKRPASDFRQDFPGGVIPGQITSEVPPAFADGIAAYAQSYNAQAYNTRNVGRTNDPIRLMLRRLRGLGVDYVAIASAGNFGQAAAFAPGSFPEVISTSASIGLDFGQLWLPSNAGEVMAPGAWYPLDGEYVAGTSFSAPAMSAITGLLLSSGDLRCNFTPLMNGAFDNRSFARAALTACGL
jgi:hypothetical protein